jgi:hypothetical protein
MIRRGVLCALLSSLLFACAGPHLGDNYGRRVRAALDQQRSRGGEGAIALDGDDAVQVMLQHRAAPGAGGAAQTGAPVTPASGIGGGMSSSGAATTPITPIRLDAVR